MQSVDKDVHGIFAVPLARKCADWLDVLIKYPYILSTFSVLITLHAPKSCYASFKLTISVLFKISNNDLTQHKTTAYILSVQINGSGVITISSFLVANCINIFLKLIKIFILEFHQLSNRIN